VTTWRSSPKPVAEALPLIARFPALADVPRARFGQYPTSVTAIDVDGRELWVKRDDLSGPRIGGNKVRGLEWLLGDVRSGEHVVTLGPRGSTHALATARCAAELGARTTVVRWNQEMNPAAVRVDALLRAEARVVDAHSVVAAYVVAATMRVLRGVRVIPAGGATPRALFGHVNAALELVEQCQGGECPVPDRVIVPFGTGGTAAGLALGFAIARVPTQIVAVRVVPRILGRRQRLLRLADAARREITRLTRTSIPSVDGGKVIVVNDYYGGAYGRPLAASARARALHEAGVRLDDTYSAKAFAAALATPGNRNLFWLTFDGRLLD